MTATYRYKDNTTCAEAVKQILGYELTSIKKWKKPAVKGKDPEGVHQIRVSLRRMRTALKLFKPLYLNKHYQRLFRQLKKFAAELDAARDLDVLLIARFSCTENGDVDVLSEHLIKQRADAYKKVKKLLKSKRFSDMRRKLNKQLKHTKCRKRKDAEPSLLEYVADLLSDKKKMLAAQSAKLDLSDDIAIHKFRIACKEFRYACEFFTSLYPTGELEMLVSEFKALQDSLGEIHDCVVHKELLQKDVSLSQEHMKGVLASINEQEQQLKKQLSAELTSLNTMLL